jgi:hypothetical protein
MKRVGSHLTYANVMATIAVFVALGGVSYAALKLPKNSVGTKQLKKNAVTTPKLKNGAVTAAKLKPGILSGAPTNSSKPGTVSGATHAISADTATTADRAANGAQRVDFKSAGIDSAPPSPPESPAVHQVFSGGGLTIRASCIKSGEHVRLYVTISASEGSADWAFTRYVNPGYESLSDGLPLGPTNVETFAVVDLTGGTRTETGELIYRSPTTTVTVVYQAGAEDVYSHECGFFGSALIATG